jgi:hypothetical protein
MHRVSPFMIVNVKMSYLVGRMYPAISAIGFLFPPARL